MNQCSLTNFNVPIPLKSRFDAICHASGRTRTSVLVELMTDYILTQSKLIASRNQVFKLVDQTLGENSVLMRDRQVWGNQSRPHRDAIQKRSNEDLAPPEFLVSNGQEGW